MKKRVGMDSILKEEKGTWWENIGCVTIVRAVFESAIAVKSLTSFLTYFLRCHKDTENLPGYFKHV